MKPTRIRMAHSLVMNYGLYKKMEIFVRLSIVYGEEELISSELSQQQRGKCHNSTRTNMLNSYIV
jgi:hypothetical protein